MALEEEGAPQAPVESESAPAPEAAEPAPTETKPEEAAQPDIDEDLRAVYRKNNRDRNPDGRFAAKDSDQSPTEETKEQAETPAIPVPESWSAEVKAKWSALPSDMQAFIAKREQEAHKQISQQGQQLKTYEPFGTLLEQAREEFGRYGIPPEEGFAQFLRANAYLERDARSAIKDLAKAYGVDLRSLIDGGAIPQNATEQALRAEIADLRRQQNEISNRVTTRERSEMERSFKSLETQIAEFAKDKPDFETLEDEIEHEIVVLKQKSPDLPATEILAKAYDRARWANPDVRAKTLEAEEKAKEAKRLEDAKKRSQDAKRVAPLNVKSSTANSSAPKSWDDDLRDAYRRSASR